MFKKEKAPMSQKDIQPTWEYLTRQEVILSRNRSICRIIQPVGSIIFLWNLLLATCNVVMYFLGEYLSDIPILPALVEKFPRESLAGTLIFSLCFAYLIPLANSGIVALIYWLTYRKKFPKTVEPLVGTEAQCARALTNKAESVYALRKEIPLWSIYLETGILTALSAIPILLACLKVVGGDTPAALEIGLYSLALLVVLFVLFWVYALLFKLFSLLNALFYFSPSEWTYYELYQKLDAYWESVDAQEYARRAEQRRIQEEKKLLNRWKKKHTESET